ncbi:hypothetical protein [Kitasatospora sp. DSM 101779]|jgi:hypothetical protein|uniref:hypothetical protein n=1 Tax=Kitasatospora sp. DSM 101779 TaxID=2853165 RepID=UPI0021D89775|nr:hypothetical protein [Kitasatospora sp. DSM 101779]MCU7826879.1 hypothetical protein [Kitasatospora sp. DSM 101779]
MADQPRQTGSPAPAPARASGADVRNAPRWTVRTAPAALAAATCYGLLQAWWALGHAPSFGRFGTDLLVFPAWGAAVLCTAAAVLSGALHTAGRPRPLLLAATATVAGALLLGCPFLLLDVVGVLLPGLHIPFSLTGFLSRGGCLAVSLLLAAAALGHRRRWWGDCPRCSRTGGPVHPDPPARAPRWAWWAAYGAVASCWLRILAQYALGFAGPGRLSSPQAASLALFEVGFVLAGTVLPLSLVHRWGRVFPRWMPLLGRRSVPRPLLLGPACAISVGLLVYFGVGIGQLVGETIHPVAHDGALPLPFLWVAMPAYWLWGLGLGVAALSYHRRTRRPCRVCGR